jgi:hypothetical protein
VPGDLGPGHFLKRRMAASDEQLRVLFQLTRMFRDEDISPCERVEQLHAFLFDRKAKRFFSFDLSTASQWDDESLQRAVYFIEEISASYTHFFHNARVIPVTYYKREKHVRRHFDHHFSIVFAEIMKRAKRSPEKELITQEPIYYLMQIAREKSFPKDRDGHANLVLLKQRIHLDLSHRLSREGSEEMRRVLLPHEIRRR